MVVAAGEEGRELVNKYERIRTRGQLLLGGRVLGESAFVEGVEYLFSRNRKLRQRTMDISTWGEESWMVDRSGACVE